jgi:hypothetical protein
VFLFSHQNVQPYLVCTVYRVYNVINVTAHKGIVLLRTFIYEISYTMYNVEYLEVSRRPEPAGRPCPGAALLQVLVACADLPGACLYALTVPHKTV